MIVVYHFADVLVKRQKKPRNNGGIVGKGDALKSHPKSAKYAKVDSEHWNFDLTIFPMLGNHENCRWAAYSRQASNCHRDTEACHRKGAEENAASCPSQMRERSASAGRRRVKTQPEGALARTVRSPPIARANSREVQSPIPNPPLPDCSTVLAR